MSANTPDSEHDPAPLSDSFLMLEGVVNQCLTDAVVANANSERYRYYMLERRRESAYPLAVICVANSVEPLGRRKSDQLRLAVPIATVDLEMPRSVLGIEAHYLYLTYMARRGGVKTLRVDPPTFARRFEGQGKPPVDDLTQKLLTYAPIPMRERPEDYS